MNHYTVIKIIGPLSNVAGVYQVLLAPNNVPEGKNLIRNVVGAVSVGDIITLLDTSKEEKVIKR